MASEYLNADNEQSEELGWVSPPAIVDQQESVFETATIQPVLLVQQCSIEKSQSQGVSDSLADDYHRYEYCSMGEMETELPSARIEDMTHRPTSLREFFPGLWSEFRSLAEELIQYGKAKSWKKKVLTVLVTATSAIVFYDLLFGDYICDRIEYFVNWMTEHSATAVLAFIALFVVSTCKSSVCLIPIRGV